MMTSNLRNAIIAFVHELDTLPPYLLLLWANVVLNVYRLSDNINIAYIKFILVVPTEAYPLNIEN